MYYLSDTLKTYLPLLLGRKQTVVYVLVWFYLSGNGSERTEASPGQAEGSGAQPAWFHTPLPTRLVPPKVQLCPKAPMYPDVCTGRDGYPFCLLTLYVDTSIPRRLDIKIFFSKEVSQSGISCSFSKLGGSIERDTARTERTRIRILTLKTGPTNQWQSQGPDWTRARPLQWRSPRSRFLDTCRKTSCCHFLLFKHLRKLSCRAVNLNRPCPLWDLGVVLVNSFLCWQALGHLL